MKRRRVIASASALASFAGCLRMTARSDAARNPATGRTNETTPTGTATTTTAGTSERAPEPAVAGLRTRWDTALSGEALLLADGTVYATTRNDTQQGVAAFAAATGEPRWFADVERLRYASLRAAPGTVFVAGREKHPATGEITGGVAAALDARTGDTIWEYRTDDAALTAVTPTDRYVLAPGADRTGSIHVLDRATGEKQWEIAEFGTDAPSRVAALHADGSTLYVAASNSLHEYDLASRTFVTHRDVNATGLAPDGDDLLVAAGTSVTAYDAASLLERWRHDLPSDAQFHGDRILARDHGVYFANGRGVTALDRDTGRHRWRTPLDGIPFSNPCTWRNALWIVDDEDTLYGLDLRDGTQHVTADVPRATGTLAATDTHLFAAGTTLTAYDAT